MKEELSPERDWEAELEFRPDLEPEARALIIELYRDYADRYDEVADEWYAVEMGARTVLDRAQAIGDLRAFVEKLRATPRAKSD